MLSGCYWKSLKGNNNCIRMQGDSFKPKADPIKAILLGPISCDNSQELVHTNEIGFCCIRLPALFLISAHMIHDLTRWVFLFHSRRCELVSLVSAAGCREYGIIQLFAAHTAIISACMGVSCEPVSKQISLHESPSATLFRTSVNILCHTPHSVIILHISSAVQTYLR